MRAVIAGSGTSSSLHTVCARVTAEFLEFSRAQGNDLTTPHPELEFPGPLLRLSDIGLEPGGECDGVSVGLTLSAAVEVEGESCE